MEEPGFHIPSRSPYGVVVNAYEGGKLVLSHLFYGDTLEEAMDIAKAHLVTDYFFSSTFYGAMGEGASELELTQDAHIHSETRVSDTRLRKAIVDLEERGEVVNEIQTAKGMFKVIKAVRNSL